MDLFHDHVDDVIAVSEMVVERNGHAIPDAAFDKGLMNGIHQLTAARIAVPANGRGRLGVFLVIVIKTAVENVLPGNCQDLFRNISADRVDHTRSPL